MQKAVLSLSLILVCLLWYRTNGQSVGSLRLVSNFGSTGGSSGRLEIYYSSQWGTVCDDSFGPTEANIACEQLGYACASSFGRVGTLGFLPASNSTRIWLAQVSCFGAEGGLSACSHNPFGFSDCSHTEDVALVCRMASDGDLRLVSNSGLAGGSSGRLEIYHNFQWGTVCDGSFGSTEADVACRQLGFDSASRFGSVGSLGYSRASFFIHTWLDEVNCFGSESRLASCSHRGYGVENCDHFDDVAVICGRPVSVTTSTTFNVAAVAAGVIVGSLVIIIILVVLCIICCVCCISNSSNSNRTVRVAQPPKASNVVTYTSTDTSTAYPTEQPPSAYPTQQDPYSHKEPINHEFSPPPYNFTAYPPPH